MTTNQPTEFRKIHGPSGFMEAAGRTLVVDYGDVYLDGTLVGFLCDDGMLRQVSGLAGENSGFRPIDDIPGCVFHGIDSGGQPLVLPSDRRGPTGSLTFNRIPLNVVHGRISTQEHRFVGLFSDDGSIELRDGGKTRKLDENTLLALSFKGRRSSRESWQYDFSRPLYRKDKKYSENEIIRYFEDFDHISGAQKKYVLESLHIWAASGLLQVVRKSEGTAALGNVKHGASGVTGVRTGYVTLDKEEFEKEILHSKKYGAIAVMATRFRPYVEVRLNQVVSHEYGHQLEFVLSAAAQERVARSFAFKSAQCDTNRPVPGGYDGSSELLLPQQVNDRAFVSGYARTSVHEYFAECVAAFSMKESRLALKEVDRPMCDMLFELVYSPSNLLRPIFIDLIEDLQASLSLGNEFHERLLD